MRHSRVAAAMEPSAPEPAAAAALSAAALAASTLAAAALALASVSRAFWTTGTIATAALATATQSAATLATAARAGAGILCTIFLKHGVRFNWRDHHNKRSLFSCRSRSWLQSHDRYYKRGWRIAIWLHTQAERAWSKLSVVADVVRLIHHVWGALELEAPVRAVSCAANSGIHRGRQTLERCLDRLQPRVGICV